LRKCRSKTWAYTNDPGQPNISAPSRQDFYAAFNIGTDDKHIATIDEAAWRWRRSKA